LGILPVDQFYYYKSAAGHEIDLVFEMDDIVHAVEVKATRKPGVRDVQNLKRFVQNMNRPVRAYLFYSGEEYITMDEVRLIPIAALFRG